MTRLICALAGHRWQRTRTKTDGRNPLMPAVWPTHAQEDLNGPA